MRSLPIPPRLQEIADSPKQLFVVGEIPDPTTVAYLAVVGSREYTSYGKHACEKLIRGLAGYPVCIVSGLALGIDGIAHKAALAAGLSTIAVPGSGLDPSVLYPAAHRHLAQDIVTGGGALLSEFEPTWKARPESFPQRNRIMAGLSHAVLVIEATQKSGTLITARLAVEYNRDVLAVPGPIDSPTSAGPHSLIKNGAALIETSADILVALNIREDHQASLPLAHLSPDERKVLELITKDHLSRDELIRTLNMPVTEANVLLAAMELKGFIHEELGFVVAR